MENQVLEMIGRRFWTGMRTDELGFKQKSYDDTSLDMSRKAEVSEFEVSSLSSANNHIR